MRRRSSFNRLALTLSVAVLVAQAMLAGVDVKVEFDKSFNFNIVRTWGWNPTGPGQVKMARTADDDPAAVQKRFEPIIVDAVTSEMKRRNLQASTGTADVAVTYYVLLTTNMSAQTVGEFLPANTAWGLPPFPPATQSLKVMNRGSLVLDLSAKDTVIWRGVAQTNVKMDIDDKRREELLREGVKDLLQRFPPKS